MKKPALIQRIDRFDDNAGLYIFDADTMDEATARQLVEDTAREVREASDGDDELDAIELLDERLSERGIERIYCRLAYTNL